MENNKPITCPRCGHKILDPPQCESYEVYCEKCQINIFAKPKFDWELWVIYKQIKKDK